MGKIRKEGIDMQSNAQNAQVPPLPLPQNEKKRLMQAEVAVDLFDAAHKEMKRKHLKIRQVMEFGLRAFLLQSNPEAARKLGIIGG
jgi:hypothetical protein